MNLDERQKNLVRRYALLFIMVLLANIVHGILFPPQQASVSVQEETVLSLGLPSEVEKQAEVYARDSPIGTELDFGECSNAVKVSDRVWELRIC